MTVTDTSTLALVEAILEVGRKRKAILDRLRAALESGDNDRALELARELCGLKDEQSN
jgi:hypothetical protein